MSFRPVRHITQAQPTMEGAGVRLRRAFGFGGFGSRSISTADTDPFLLLDDFRGDRPEDYQAGFPWHPHRGMETITYILAGTVAHGDSLGNHGSLGPGDVQWMTAGSGIVHQEMPEGDEKGRMYGFQLWANLPASLKMTEPRYQDVNGGDIPEVADEDGTRVRVICGSFGGVRGPVDGIAADPRYLDVSVPAGVRKTLPVEKGHTVFAYVFEGAGSFGDADSQERAEAGNRTLVLFDESGDEVLVQSDPTASGIRFLLVSGKPIREPVAWRGPIVMNTDAEIRKAYAELQNGTFIKKPRP